jgi:hypothetical protein
VTITPTTNLIQITATPKGRGRFTATRDADGAVLVKSSSTPFFAAARALMGQCDPFATLAMRHRGSPHVAMTGIVSLAAKLTVRDNSGGTPTFAQWSPLGIDINAGDLNP